MLRRLCGLAYFAVLACSLRDGEPWELYQGPNNTAEFPSWLQQWSAWAEKTRRQANITGHVFENPALFWTQVHPAGVKCARHSMQFTVFVRAAILHSAPDASVRPILLRSCQAVVHCEQVCGPLSLCYRCDVTRCAWCMWTGILMTSPRVTAALTPCWCGRRTRTWVVTTATKWVFWRCFQVYAACCSPHLVATALMGVVRHDSSAAWRRGGHKGLHR